MMFSSLPPPEQVVPIVGIVATSNGRTCDVHRFGCGNALLLSRPARGCGVLLHLRKTGPDTLAAFFVLRDGSDGCRVEFTPREHSVGAHGDSLDGAIVWVLRCIHLIIQTLTAMSCITGTLDMHWQKRNKILIVRLDINCSS